MNCTRIRLFSILLTFLSLNTGIHAQNRRVDSLRKKLATYTLEDTNKAWTLDVLAWSLAVENSLPEALQYADQAMRLSEKLNYKVGTSVAYNTKGLVSYVHGDYKAAEKNYSLAYYIAKEKGYKKGMEYASSNLANVYTHQGKYPEALKTLYENLAICQEWHDNRGVANIYNNIGIVQETLGDFPEALNNIFKALKLREELKDFKSIADSYNNVGLIYEKLHNYPDALKYHALSMKIKRERGDEYGIASSFNNMGIVYDDMGNYAQALQSHQACRDIHKKLDDKLELGQSYNNIGLTYLHLKDYSQALSNFNSSIDIRRQLEDREGMAECYTNLAAVYTKLRRFVEAGVMLDSAEMTASRIHLKPGMEQTYDQWQRLDSTMGNYKGAFDHLKKYLVYHDSIFNEASSQKTVRAEMNFEFDKKQAVAKAEQERITAVAASESKKQRIVIISVSALLILIFAFALFAYRNYLTKNRINLRLEIQKKNIDDSIQYASRIQQAILPKSLFLSGEVKEHFLLFLPKDIVSGDFYWRHQAGRELFFAAVDCTGHGVPGAMMSMLGYDLLEYAVKDKGLREPAEILNLMNSQIIEKLNTDQGQTATDGMDLTLCRFNLNTRELVYAGAKNDLFLFSNNELITLRVTKCSIGYSAQMEYTQSSRSLKNNDQVFLLTDGYSDQKGGPEKKKFMLRKLKDLLEKVSPLPCPEQESRLLAAFEDWKGSYPQKDDVLFVGFKV